MYMQSLGQAVSQTYTEKKHSKDHLNKRYYINNGKGTRTMSICMRIFVGK